MANRVKRIPRKKAAPAPAWRKMMPEPVAEIEAAVEKRVRKGVEQLAEMIPADPRKALQRVTADIKRFRRDLEKSGDKLVVSARKRVRGLRSEIRKRAEELAGDLQTRVEETLTPLVKRLDVASRTDVERLRKRLDHVERRLDARAGHSSALA